MCCLFTTLVLLGPRFFLIFWWLFQPVYFNLRFDTWILPLLGILFLPWTTLMYVIIFPVVSFDWLWLGLALLADIAGYVGGAARRKDASFYTGP